MVSWIAVDWSRRRGSSTGRGPVLNIRRRRRRLHIGKLLLHCSSEKKETIAATAVPRLLTKKIEPNCFRITHIYNNELQQLITFINSFTHAIILFCPKQYKSPDCCAHPNHPALVIPCASVSLSLCFLPRTPGLSLLFLSVYILVHIAPIPFLCFVDVVTRGKCCTISSSPLANSFVLVMYGTLINLVLFKGRSPTSAMLGILCTRITNWQLNCGILCFSPVCFICFAI